ncbi:MAG: amidohydrolase family protein [Rhodospirillaceae bacterium]
MRPTAIDLHAHWYPKEWIALLERDGPGHGGSVSRMKGMTHISGGGIANAIDDSFIDLDLRLQKMDAAKVDVHVLSLTAPMVHWAPPQLGLALAQCYNDAASAAHRRHPTRFYGAAALPWQAPDLAVHELERCAHLPGMRAIYLGTNINGTELDEQALWPVYAKAEQLGWPILLHPLRTIGPDRTARYYLKNLLGNPYDTGVAAAHLIFGGVLDAFPSLEVMLPHAGGTLIALIGRLDHGTRVRPELEHMTKLPSEYLRRFTYDTISHNDQLTLNLVRMVGADRVTLGSDYCFDMGYEQPVDVIQRLDLPQSERDLMTGGNAARLIGLR